MINAAGLEWIRAGLTGDADTLVFKDEAGQTMIEITVPSGLISVFVANNAIADVSVHLDGTLHVEILEDDGPGISVVTPKITIDDLVARDTTPDMLEDEPDAAHHLEVFENRLKRCLALVAAARRLITPDKME